MHAYGPLYARNPAIGWIRCFQPGVRREEIQPRPFDAEFPSIFISATCLFQKFIIIHDREQERCIFYHACVYMFDNNEHVCHSLLVISSVAINIPLFIQCISVYTFIRDNLDIYYCEFSNDIVILSILKYPTNAEQKRKRKVCSTFDLG